MNAPLEDFQKRVGQIPIDAEQEIRGACADVVRGHAADYRRPLALLDALALFSQSEALCLLDRYALEFRATARVTAPVAEAPDDKARLVTCHRCDYGPDE